MKLLRCLDSLSNKNQSPTDKTGSVLQDLCRSLGDAGLTVSKSKKNLCTFYCISVSNKQRKLGVNFCTGESPQLVLVLAVLEQVVISSKVPKTRHRVSRQHRARAQSTARACELLVKDDPPAVASDRGNRRDRGDPREVGSGEV